MLSHRTGTGDLRPDLLETPWFHRELKSMLEQDRRECAKHLAETASRPEKFFLAKMIRLGPLLCCDVRPHRFARAAGVRNKSVSFVEKFGE